MAKDKKSKGKPADNDYDEDEYEEVETPEEPSTENPPPAEEESGQGEPAVTPPAAGPRTVTVAGTGRLSIMVNGEVHSIERGKATKLDPAVIESVKAMGETVEDKAEEKKK